MANFWKARLQLINYGKEESITGPSADASRTLSDWDRLAKAKPQTYFINEQALSDIAPNGFKDLPQLHSFFKEHLFKNIKEPEQQDQIVAAISQHLYQSGLPHATSSSVQTLNTREQQVAQPAMRIDFNATSNGVNITETNTYTKWIQTLENGKIKQHNRSEENYYAKTKSVYNVTMDGITLKELDIDCPSKNLAKLFDNKPAINRNVFAFVQDCAAAFIKYLSNAKEEKKAPEEQALFQFSQRQ